MIVHGSKERVHCTLLCVTCDLPAGRKVCGFQPCHGCSRCIKFFPGTVDQMDFSGFDHNNWIPQTCEDHIEAREVILKNKTKTDVSKIENKHGYRNSVLLELPYFNPSRILVIDPMHTCFWVHENMF